MRLARDHDGAALRHRLQGQARGRAAASWRSSAIPIGRVGLDESGRVGIDFGVYGVPETYVIDKAGRIRLRHVGPLTAEAVSKELLPLLKMLGRS